LDWFIHFFDMIR